MRRVRFIAPDGYERTGNWTDDGIETGAGRFDPEEVRFLPPSEPTKVVSVAPNYVEVLDMHEKYTEAPPRPGLFTKPANTAAAHHDEIELPGQKDPVDVECELGVVFGEQARAVSADEAMDYVAGYTVVCDMSNREDMDIDSNMFLGKGWDSSAPMGPVLVPPEDVPEDAHLENRVNGEVVQESNVGNMIWSVPELIEEASQFTTFEPGDVISTGTPPGWHTVHDGDEVELEIEGIGTLEISIRRTA